MDRILNEFETMSPQALAELQLERLKRQLTYVYENSAFYRRKFGETGVLPADIETRADLRKLPFTSKNELRQCNEDFICVEN